MTAAGCGNRANSRSELLSVRVVAVSTEVALAGTTVAVLGAGAATLVSPTAPVMSCVALSGAAVSGLAAVVCGGVLQIEVPDLDQVLKARFKAWLEKIEARRTGRQVAFSLAPTPPKAPSEVSWRRASSKAAAAEWKGEK